MCYKHDPTNRTWTEALKSCVLSNPSSTLASVHDNVTNDFLTTLSGGSEWTWVGGFQDDDKIWTWADESEYTGYNNWGPGQPDNLGGKDDHLGLNYPAAGNWNDFNGDYPQGSICQYDPFQTAAPASTCSPVGAQCSNSGTDVTGFEDVTCCEGSVCNPLPGQSPATTEPFFCIEI